MGTHNQNFYAPDNSHTALVELPNFEVFHRAVIAREWML